MRLLSQYCINMIFPQWALMGITYFCYCTNSNVDRNSNPTKKLPTTIDSCYQYYFDKQNTL